MDFSAITQLIGSLGFPIAACIALFIQSNRQSEQHREETKELQTAINNNTIALQKLIDKIDRE